MAVPEIHFCRRCGHAVEQRIPPMEDRLRAVCPNCGYIDYVNPINVVGTVPVWQHEDGEPRILICRRAIQPRRGYWTLPAGYMEVGETAAEGAARETREEAGAHIELEGLFSVLDAVHVRQVHLFYRARLLDLDLAPGPETIENALVRIEEIPWADLAFHSVRRVLQDWVADYRGGSFGVHNGSVERTR